MNYDEEKTNRLFSVFCYAMLLALIAGVLLGSFITYFLVK
jgi:F0F1-type ATP synthase assembly protein I